MADLLAAFALVFAPDVLLVILAAAAFGLFAGAMPGISATVAVALLVPITFFMPPVAALAAIATAVAIAIFAGDLPGALLRIPGTPASAAYADEAYAMTRRGEGVTALRISLVCSALGGMVGALALALAAPALAEFALNFQYYEYFWLAVIGLTTAAFVCADQPLKGLVTMTAGLMLSTVGYDMISGAPRYTFGVFELMEGIHFIPAMIGAFAVSEVIRHLVAPAGTHIASGPQRVPPMREVVALAFRGRGHVARGSAVGVVIGALPGAGADMAAWISYALARRASRTPERFGKGHPEGIVAASSSNNAASCATWIPSLVFGIPGDTVTAIVIGVMFLKGLQPGPTIFVEDAPLVYSIFIAFFLANVVMIPVGLLAIHFAKQLLRVPTDVLMPLVLIFCVVGAFAINNSMLGVTLILVFGVAAFVLQENGFPIAPMILGMVLGGMLEQSFVQAMIVADGDLTAFFGRPIAAVLGTVAVLLWIWPLVRMGLDRRRARTRPPFATEPGSAP
jgi:putative tricarboxylic transport membrane protein